jgi:hypothetical protein
MFPSFDPSLYRYSFFILRRKYESLQRENFFYTLLKYYVILISQSRLYSIVSVTNLKKRKKNLQRENSIEIRIKKKN